MNLNPSAGATGAEQGVAADSRFEHRG